MQPGFSDHWGTCDKHYHCVIHAHEWESGSAAACALVFTAIKEKQHTWPSTEEETNNVGNLHKEIGFHLKKEWSAGTCYYTGEPRKLHVTFFF